MDPTPVQPPIIPPPQPSPGPPKVNVISSQKSGPPKKLLLLATVSVLILGIIVAVYLVRSRQLFGIGAIDCTLYGFNLDSSGNLTATNNQSVSSSAQTATVSINGSGVNIFDVPALSSGQTASIGRVSVPASGYNWTVTGSSFCSSSGIQTATAPTPRPTLIPTLIPTPELTPTPIPNLAQATTISPTPLPSAIPTPTSIPLATATPTATLTPIPIRTPTPASSSTPTPTAQPQLLQTGAFDTTIALSLGGIIIIGLGLLLAL